MKLLGKAILTLAIAGIGAVQAIAQTTDKSPTDYLSASFHAVRRQALRDMMPANSVTVIFAYPERVFSNDVNYVYHANPDLYYFSGYKEPDAALLIFKDMQGAGDSAYNEVLFVRKRDASREIWTGKRLGVDGAKTKLGFKRAYNSEAFAGFPIDFKKFSEVIYDGLPADATGELAGLIKSFKEKVNAPTIDSELSGDLGFLYERATPELMPRVVAYLKPKLEKEAYKNSPIIQQLIAKPDAASLQDAKAKIKALLGGMQNFQNFTLALRGVKTPEELVLLKKSVALSSIAHAEVMRAVKPTMSERELEGILLYVHKKYGAEDEGYPPIIGVGGNGCILHYEENSAMKLDNQLVLLDVGAEYHGYSADVTRTIPANGKFSEEQKAIYQLVYDAQEEVFKLCKAGVPYADLEKKTGEVLAAGLIKLGIIKTEADLRKYYPHGVSHHLGLDVHDKGDYSGELKENMVITVEPGIYIPAGSECDKKWWNIGVRIEDDILIGKEKGTNLSADAPRTWQDVEKMAAQKSIFDAVNLPAIK
ncbi:aminopeptidase P N-terminal domain-containing protein [Mucilaginibacter sp. JRF]|uniref:aminopeptidase P family protein n=1 Tax=Mucilaginibacter sp. JRF TaxID=2780088 RepID=UPI00187F1737|nr:aminopeptidase P family protein [Mucilaginibacter sp. JRF]MBE9584815.1 aminopeptidase P N-terminal domain-containing protein [Mucilaginibacter sp. JRF]